MRQICVWEYANSVGNTELWWDYSIKWNENCVLTEDAWKNFTQECSFTQMQDLDESLLKNVVECIMDSGGYEPDGGRNTKLDEAIKLSEESGISQKPVIPRLVL